MHFAHSRSPFAVLITRCAVSALLFVAALVATASPALAQMRGQVYVSGLHQPVAFVQDPTNPAIQFVVQKEGVIRVVSGGALQPGAFLDLSADISTDGERGLVSLAFPPDAATSRRFFVAFANTSGNLVVSRFHRSLDPLAADKSSRFDLQWSTGERSIPHPHTLHYGANLVFGPDGLLFVGTGDGGEPNDASHNAQNTGSLLGKMLRIDVNVGDGDVEGFDIPAGNPFAGGGGAPEIWSIGFRNPWRFSIDDPARGGTGALIIADVGEDAIEELNYEPAGRPGRNYGWRNREGAHDHALDPPPAYGPLTDPIFEYDHGFGRSITGGYVYRGAGIPAMQGRYIFADFVRGKVCSLALNVDPASGEATASDLREHTSEINSGALLRMISSFGLDANGEIYAINYLDGTIVALKASTPPAPVLRIETPINGATVRQPFTISGWALDPAAANPGIGTIHVWAFPAVPGPARFIGVASYGISRPDVAAIYGPQFVQTGFTIPARGLPPGGYWIAAYGWVNAVQNFTAVATAFVNIEPAGVVTVDTPANGSTVDSAFMVAGWAIDPAAVSGAGVSTIHIWGFRADGTQTVFLGVPQMFNRPDVGAAFGSQFLHSGYGTIVTTLSPGTWWIAVYAMSAVSGQFDATQAFWVVVR
jgi:glucose/arabinose dehydrogenase